MITSDNFSEEQSRDLARLDQGWTSADFSRLSPVLDNVTELSTSGYECNQTPRRKLSLSNTSINSGSLSASNARLRTPGSQGIQFKSFNVSTDLEDSPYLQYRTVRCSAIDSASKKSNESSPTRSLQSRGNERRSVYRSNVRPVFSTSRKKLSLADDDHEEVSPQMMLQNGNTKEQSDCFPGFGGLPDCSPLLLSPTDGTPHDTALPVNLHFDSALLRSSVVPAADHTSSCHRRKSADTNEEIDDSSSLEIEPQFPLSSTPLHSRTAQTSSDVYVPRRILHSSSPDVIDKVCTRLQLTPVTIRRSQTFDDDDQGSPRMETGRISYELARRTLFHFDSPQSYPVSPASKDSPSSGFESMGSSNSNTNSSGSSCRDLPTSDDFDKLDSLELENKSGNTEIETFKPDDGVVKENADLQRVALVDLDAEENDGDIINVPLLNFDGEQHSLIGDFTRPYALPLVIGKHPDLKAVSPDTVASVVSGEYDSTVNQFLIVDCRYPYEFKGGHINGAKNVYSHEGLITEFFTDTHLQLQNNSDVQTILIFHCEFSSERAPKLLRFLRNKDRDFNRANYPMLHYPELYVLEGGYKAFFASHPELCEPRSYVPMVHCNHSDDMRKFRAKTRSYETERGKRFLKKRCSSVIY